MATRTRIKMCGMTQVGDIKRAIELGVDAIGLIFYAKSARAISIEQAVVLVQAMTAFVDVVAVLVNPDKAWVRELISEIPIQYLQFHGDESADFCEQFAMPYIKAVAATSTEAIIKATTQFRYASAVLLDTPAGATHGGSGVAFDWHIIPKSLAAPIILAGGLNAANVKHAVIQCTPYAVDVCSGIERSAGIKDHGKMQDFVNAIGGLV